LGRFLTSAIEGKPLSILNTARNQAYERWIFAAGFSQRLIRQDGARGGGRRISVIEISSRHFGFPK
jgi:hypothetical protein